jgi:hypothetical protein
MSRRLTHRRRAPADEKRLLASRCRCSCSKAGTCECTIGIGESWPSSTSWNYQRSCGYYRRGFHMYTPSKETGPSAFRVQSEQSSVYNLIQVQRTFFLQGSVHSRTLDREEGHIQENSPGGRPCIFIVCLFSMCNIQKVQGLWHWAFQISHTAMWVLPPPSVGEIGLSPNLFRPFADARGRVATRDMSPRYERSGWSTWFVLTDNSSLKFVIGSRRAARERRRLG